MAMALFTGAAALGTNESLLRWREQREAERARRVQEEIQQRQLEMQQAQLEWEKESQRLYEQFQLGVIDRQERERFALKTIELMQQTPDPQGRLRMWQALDSIGSSYAGLAEGLLSDSLISDPQQALEYLQNLANAEPGQGFDVNVTRVYAQAAARFMGLSGQEADEFVQSYVDLANDLNAGKETIDQTKTDAARLGVQDLAAGIELKQAQTESIRQQTAERDERLSWDRELHPEVYRASVAQADLLEQQAIQEAIRNDYLPEQLRANNNLIWEQIRDLDNRNELFEATFEDQVRLIAANADIQEEEARHLLATAHVRDALVQGDLDRVQATVDLLKAQTDTERAQAEYLGVQAESARVANETARIGILMELVTKGQPHMLATFAPQLLEGMVSEEDMPGLIDALTGIASQRLDDELKMSEASARVAMAQADYEERTLEDRVASQAAQRRALEAGADIQEFQRDFWHEDREFDQWLKRENLRIQEAQANAYIASLNRPAGIGSANPLEVLKDIKDGTGWTIEKLESERATLAEMEADLAVLMEAATSGTLTDVTWLVDKWGLAATNLEAAVAALQTKIESKRTSITNGYQAILDGGMSRNIMFTPGMLGLSEDDPFYRAAIDRYPFFRQASAEFTAQQQATRDRVDQRLAQAATANTEDWFLTGGGAKAVYDELVNDPDVGAERLADIGIHSAADLLDDYESASQEYKTHAESVKLMGQALGFDTSIRQGRDSLQAYLTSLDLTADDLLTDIRTLAAAGGGSSVQRRAILQRVQNLLTAYYGGIPLEQVAPNLANPFTGDIDLQAAIQYVSSVQTSIPFDIQALQYINTHGF